MSDFNEAFAVEVARVEAELSREDLIRLEALRLAIQTVTSGTPWSTCVIVAKEYAKFLMGDV